MNAGRRICETVHAAALGMWLGALVVTGASAAMLFPAMKGLNPELPAFAGYTGPHWLIAGGQVVQRLFLALDVAQFVAMLLSLGTFAVSAMWLGLPLRRSSTVVRVALLLALVGILSYRLGFFEPEMQDLLRRYWGAAAAGDNETALRLKAQFDAGHPVQSRLLGATAALVLASLVAGIWSFARDRGVESPAPGGPELQEPMLARGRR